MQAAAITIRFLTGCSSKAESADSESIVSDDRLLHRIVANHLFQIAHSQESFVKLASKLIQFAEQAFFMRDLDALEEASRVLMNLPIDSARQIGLYYHALAINQHTYGFDAFDNMTTRGGRNGYVPISAQPINYNATYVNDRNQAWTYNASGNVLIADQQQYQWDAAGQMSRAQTMNLYLYRDGDGQDVLRSLDGVDTYYIRSSVLGGLVVGEIGVNGGHQRTYLYANGRRIARQKDGNTYWLSQDAANVANIETDINGEIWARAQLDPLGVLTGTGPPGQTPPGGSFNTSGYYGNPGSPGDGCRLDGAPMPCDWVARVVNAGNAVQCPNNDCGPIPIRDSQGNPTGGFESFRALGNGRSGWLPINAIFNGSGNGSWHYPGSDFGGQLPMGSLTLATVLTLGPQNYDPRVDFRDYARSLSRQSGQKGYSDCLALALLIYKAGQIWNQAGPVVNGLLNGLTEFSNIGPLGGTPPSDPNYRVGVRARDPYYEKSFGATGFKQEFQDPGNQVRHFIFYFAAGSKVGTLAARYGLSRSETPYNASNPDVALGWAAIEAGHKLKGGNYRNIAQIVWHEICGETSDLSLP